MSPSVLPLHIQLWENSRAGLSKATNLEVKRTEEE